MLKRSKGRTVVLIINQYPDSKGFGRDFAASQRQCNRNFAPCVVAVFLEIMYLLVGGTWKSTPILRFS
jgi:hypothetical protein